MDAKDRIIIALDVPDMEEALRLVGTLEPHVGFFKIGLELLTSFLARLATYETDRMGAELLRYRQLLSLFDGRVFWDQKLHDIPNTVAGAMTPLTYLGVGMTTVHCTGSVAMMRAAADAARDAAKASPSGEAPKILGVTLLTSLSFADLSAMGLAVPITVEDEEMRAQMTAERMRRIVWTLARLAKVAGLDGVVASPKEIEVIRAECGDGFLIVTPGVRPAWAASDDQKRVMTPGDAVKSGADYLVIGRPVTKPPPEIGSPVEAAKRIADEIGEALSGKTVTP